MQYRVLLFCLFLAVFGCRKNPQLPSNKQDEQNTEAMQLMELNKLLAEVEAENIRKFIDEQETKFSKDNFGYWVSTVKKGSGKQLKKGVKIELRYSIELLDGSICYDYVEKGKTIVVGKNEAERGLDAVLPTLREGSEAIVIAPSHLGYGILGDRKKIPPRSTLVYRIKNIQIK